MPTQSPYDVIIVGGGPAGLTAGLYTSRAKLKTAIIEGSAIGGRMAEAWEIENYPGFVESINGYDLTQRMHEQTNKFGVEHIQTGVNGIEDQGPLKIVKTSLGEYAGKVLIIAGGSERRKLGIPGEKELIGRGVSFCATCDGPFFRNKTVAVVGGGNGALNEAIHLTHFAEHVYVIHRRDKLRATPVLQEKARSDPKISFIFNADVVAIEGSDTVERIIIKDVINGDESIKQVRGVFIAVGLIPNTEYLKGAIALNQFGAVITNVKMETNVPGIYAAGDVRADSVRQVVSAAGDGATAASYAQEYLTGIKA